MNASVSVPPPPPLPIGHIIVMVFSWTSFLIYVNLLSIILYRSKKHPILTSPVYSILLYNSIGDICMFFHSEIVMRPRKYRLFGLFDQNTPDILAYYSYFIMSYLRIVMILGYVVLAANRFSAFVTPFLYKKIWRTQNIAVITIILWLLSAILTLIIFVCFPTNLYFQILPNGVLQIIAGDLFLRDAIEVAVVSLTSCLICILFYTGGAIYAKKSAEASYLERKLFVCSLLASIPLLIESCKAWYLLYGVLQNSNDIVLMVAEWWFYWTEIMTSVQCWSVLLITPSARKLLLQEGIFGRFFRSSGRVTIISFPSTTAS